MSRQEPDGPAPRERCPCCDYLSLAERGSYLICPVCFWEDDGQDVDELDLASAPNGGLTLREARRNFRELGACEPGMAKNVVPEAGRSAYRREPRGS